MRRDNDASDQGDQMQYQAQQDEYQDQQQRYQHDQQAYSAQQQNYWDERADYNFDRTHPGAWWHDRYQQASLNHFYDLPRSELVDLRVVREDGFTRRPHPRDRPSCTGRPRLRGARRVPQWRHRLDQGARSALRPRRPDRFHGSERAGAARTRPQQLKRRRLNRPASPIYMSGAGFVFGAMRGVPNAANVSAPFRAIHSAAAGSLKKAENLPKIRLTVRRHPPIHRASPPAGQHLADGVSSLAEWKFALRGGSLTL